MASYKLGLLTYLQWCVSTVTCLYNDVSVQWQVYTVTSLYSDMSKIVYAEPCLSAYASVYDDVYVRWRVSMMTCLNSNVSMQWHIYTVMYLYNSNYNMSIQCHICTITHTCLQKLRDTSYSYKIEGVYTSAEGEKRHNVPKNRYKDIVPCKPLLTVLHFINCMFLICGWYTVISWLVFGSVQNKRIAIINILKEFFTILFIFHRSCQIF